MALALLKDIPKMPLMCYDQCKGGNIMGCFYWLIVGWWLEPILFVIMCKIEANTSACE